MSIHFVTGKPGGGKGLYSMKLIYDEIVGGNRPIITNLAVKLDPWLLNGEPQIGLRGYLSKKHGNTFDIDNRLVLLSDEQCKEFFRHRGGGVVADVELEKGKVVSFDTRPAMEGGGVLYVLDECWKFFGARDWQDTGKGVLFYASQHRKFGDDVLIVTQSSKQIDAALVRVAQDFTVVRNHGKEKLGPFRQPNVFTTSTFAEPPSGALGQMPMERKVFRIDVKGLAACYDTSAGVGIMGRGSADTRERKKGVSIGWLLAGLVVVLVLLAMLPKTLGWIAGRTIAGAVKIGTNAVHQVSTAIVKTNSPAPLMASTIQGGVTNLNEIVPDRPKTLPEGVVWVTGYSRSGNAVKVWLSDGRTFTQQDRELQFIGRDYVIVDRVKYRFAPPTAAPPSAPLRSVRE